MRASCHVFFFILLEILMCDECSWCDVHCMWLHGTGGVIPVNFHRPVACVLGVLEGWNFLCIVTPSWGADNQNFKKKSTKNFFLSLISPTHYPAYNFCSKGPRGLKFVMRIDPPHAEPTTTFLFQNSTKIVHFFNFQKKHVLREFSPITSVLTRSLKFVMRIFMPNRLPHFSKNLTKNVHFFNLLKKTLFLREFSLLRLITYVLRVLGVWNLICVLTPLMRDRLPHFCFKIRRKLFIFSTFSKKN